MTQNINVNKGEGKYTLNTFHISTPTRTFDMAGIAVAVSIYENILSPSAVCVVTAYDATGLFDKIDFTEQEMCISWYTNEDGKDNHYTFKIIECSPAKTIQSGKGVTFTFTGVSAEAVKSRTIKDIQFVRPKIEIDQAVSIILDVMESKKTRFFEKTKGLFNVSKTRVNPLEAIDQLRSQAISDQYQGSAFVFFENSKGLHFKCLEKLIDEGKKNIGDKVFFNIPTAGLSTTEASNWRNILAYKIIQNGNQNVLLATGGSSVRLQVQNTKSRKIEEIRKKVTDFNFIKLNDGTVSGSMKNIDQNTQDEGRVIKLLVHPDTEQNDLRDKYAAEACYLSEFLSVINHITIYGDTEIAAGDVITCHFRQASGLTIGQGNKDSYQDDNEVISGNYLVTKCRHELTFGDTPEYYQGLEIIKDGIYSPAKKV